MSENPLTRQNIWELPSARNSYGKITSTTSVVKPIRLLVSCVATWSSLQSPLKKGIQIISQTITRVCLFCMGSLSWIWHFIEMVQWRAARYVTNRQRNTSSVNDMLQHLKWHSLEDRCRDARLVMMYKIPHDKVAVRKMWQTFTTPETLQKYTLSVISGPIM
jgi:hypothetical protein